MYFNSQPHKEADFTGGDHCNVQNYFNSQPHKEADEKLFKRKKHRDDFNSQPHKEADGQDAADQAEKNAFQLTASQGG